MKARQTAKELKKATGLPDGRLAHSEAVVEIRRTLLRKTPPKNSEERTEVLALAEHLAGESQMYVEDKYALSRGAVARLLRRVFPTQEAQLDFLETCFTANAMLASQIFAEKANDMSAYQAAAAAGIFAKSLINLKQARATNFQERQPVPVNLLVQLKEALTNANG